MSDRSEIQSALEETTKSRRSRPMLDPDARASVADVRFRRDDILRFLRELDGETLVEELCDALDEYRGDTTGEDE